MIVVLSFNWCYLLADNSHEKQILLVCKVLSFHWPPLSFTNSKNLRIRSMRSPWIFRVHCKWIPLYLRLALKSYKSFAIARAASLSFSAFAFSVIHQCVSLCFRVFFLSLCWVAIILLISKSYAGRCWNKGNCLMHNVVLLFDTGEKQFLIAYFQCISSYNLN